MRPIDMAREWYDDVKEFNEVVDYCLFNGGVHSDRKGFVCCYKCDHRLIENPQTAKKGLDKADTWFVVILAGSIEKILELDLDGMEYVAWKRFDGKVRLFKTDKVKRRFQHGKRT